MTKLELLAFLDDSGGADAFQVAEAFDVDYPAAAMALLRLSRQALIARHVDGDSGLLWYDLTDHGAKRLAYLEADAP